MSDSVLSGDDSAVRRTWRDSKALKVGVATKKPGLQEKLASWFFTVHTEFLNFHWIVPSLSQSFLPSRSFNSLSSLHLSPFCFPNVRPLPFYLPHTLYFDFSLRPTSVPPLQRAASRAPRVLCIPADTMPPIHITSRDSGTNFLKATSGCATPWSAGWRENWDGWTGAWEKADRRFKSFTRMRRLISR